MPLKHLFLAIAAMCMLPMIALAQRDKIAVLPTQVDSSVKGLPDLFDEIVLGAVQNASAWEVIGQDDVSALLGFEKQKDLLGCADTTCFINIGGALGVDRLLVLSVARVSDEWVTAAKLINIRETKVESRSSEFVKGDVKALIDAVPIIISHLLSGGGVGTGVQPSTTSREPEPKPKPKPVKVKVRSTPVGADVRIDGKSVGATVFETELLPGTYQLELEMENFANATQEFQVQPGPELVMSLALKEGLSNSQLSARSRSAAFRWITTGIAAAALGVWGWQGLRARSLKTEVEDLPPGSSDLDDKVSSGSTAAKIADGALVGGALTGGLAAFLWITADF